MPVRTRPEEGARRIRWDPERAGTPGKAAHHRKAKRMSRSCPTLPHPKPATAMGPATHQPWLGSRVKQSVQAKLAPPERQGVLLAVGWILLAKVGALGWVPW